MYSVAKLITSCAAQETFSCFSLTFLSLCLKEFFVGCIQRPSKSACILDKINTLLVANVPNVYQHNNRAFYALAFYASFMCREYCYASRENCMQPNQWK